jgi:hypothetical protein
VLDWLFVESVFLLVWEELIFHRLFAIHAGAHTDYLVGWGEELASHGRSEGLAAWRVEVLRDLPSTVEFQALASLGILLAMLLRPLFRVTPGEWAFSVRRSPLPPPPGGISRKLWRATGGLAAWFGFHCLCAILSMLLDPP